MDFYKYYKSQADHGMTGYGNYDAQYKIKKNFFSFYFLSILLII